MPKVPPSYLEARRRGILAAAQRCFGRNGIHGTTMRDICRAANLSPGGLYRYFSGKEAILEALAAGRQRQIGEFFGRLAGASASRGAFLAAVADLAAVLDDTAAQDGLRLDLRLWNEALNAEEVNSTLVVELRSVLERLAPEIPGSADRAEREAIGRVVVALLQGLALQKALEPDLELRSLLDPLRKLLSIP
jgi:AcrR family transcriptional regulator